MEESHYTLTCFNTDFSPNLNFAGKIKTPVIYKGAKIKLLVIIM